MSLIEDFKVFKNGIDNWFSVALNMFILKRDVDCKIKNIGTLNWKEAKIIWNPLYLEHWSFQIQKIYQKNKLRF